MLVIRTLTIIHIYSMLTPLRHVNLYTLYYVSPERWARTTDLLRMKQLLYQLSYDWIKI